MKGNKVEKPITLLREEFSERLLSLINESGLPFFVVEDVMKNIIPNVSAAANKQLDIDRQSYLKALEEYKTEEENKAEQHNSKDGDMQ